MSEPKNIVRVSSKRSKFFYTDLTKRLLHEGEKEVILTGLNSSIADAVSIAEMMKAQGVIKVTKIQTSRGIVAGSGDEEQSHGHHADRIEITVVKTGDFDKIYEQQLKERDERRKAKENNN